MIAIMKPHNTAIMFYWGGGDTGTKTKYFIIISFLEKGNCFMLKNFGN